MSFIMSALLVAASYLLGSIPFAVVVSRAMGLKDPRSFGSGNPGATNVLRTGNKKAAIFTLLGDAAKGWLAVWATMQLAAAYSLPVTVIALSAVAGFLGHVFSVFLRFKGGKGVATALGVLLALNPWLALATAATWLIVAYATRYSSLAALIAAVFAPLYYLLGGNVAWRLEPTIALAIVVISVVLCTRHRANISRLIQGKEERIGQKKGAGPRAGGGARGGKR